MGKKTHTMALRLTAEGYALLQALADASGTTKAAQIEQAIRAYAKQQGVTAPPQQPPEEPRSE